METAPDWTHEMETASGWIREMEAASHWIHKMETVSDWIHEMETASDWIPGIETASDWIREMETASDWTHEMDTASDWIHEMETASDWIQEMETASDWIHEMETAWDTFMKRKRSVSSRMNAKYGVVLCKESVKMIVCGTVQPSAPFNGTCFLYSYQIFTCPRSFICRSIMSSLSSWTSLLVWVIFSGRCLTSVVSDLLNYSSSLDSFFHSCYFSAVHILVLPFHSLVLFPFCLVNGLYLFPLLFHLTFWYLCILCTQAYF